MNHVCICVLYVKLLYNNYQKIASLFCKLEFMRIHDGILSQSFFCKHISAILVDVIQQKEVV